MLLSNGELCVALDHRGLVRDMYYPHVGYEDHVRGHYLHHVGIFTDNHISWLADDPNWRIIVGSGEEALASTITARNDAIQVELHFTDVVYNERAIFLRIVNVTNLRTEPREIKLYMAHQYEIGKTHGGETAYYDPVRHCIIHYKGRRVFLMNATLDGQQFDDYAVGLINSFGQEGTFLDANDGKLSQNAIEHGLVDSVMGLYAQYAGGQTRQTCYWVCAGQSIPAVHALNDYCIIKSPRHLVRTTSDYWRAWINAYQWSFHGLSKDHIVLFKRSLMLLRAHVDVDGGILASLDSDMLQSGNDTYSYIWPRDGAYAAMALDRAGDTNVARRFFEYCSNVMTSDGYLMHKYLPDRSLGSSWHPWIKDGKFQLPIQEDETASVIVALRDHYRYSRDLEFLEAMYNTLVETAGNFMVEYRDLVTRLPLPTYDLWEEKRGSSTYTCSAVYGALKAAAELSKILGKLENETRYETAADEVRDGILRHLWSETDGVFLRMIHMGPQGTDVERTIDMSSAYGPFAFGILPPDDQRMTRAFENTVRALSDGVAAGGMGRYVGDIYSRDDHRPPGNPWFITTLWYAEYLIAVAKNEKDLEKVKDIFTWVTKHALASGVLAEQIRAETGESTSAAPLAWSHAAYITAVLKYMDKIEELGLATVRKS